MSDFGIWRRIGRIGVDSGMVVVADPCYLIHRRRKLARDLGKEWEGFAERVHAEWGRNEIQGAQLLYDKGHAGLGVVTGSGNGDGLYDVWGRFAGDECRELRITFDGDFCGMQTPAPDPDGSVEMPAIEGPQAPCEVDGCSANGVCFCDYPVTLPDGRSKLCRRRLCDEHRHEAEAGVDLCPEHAPAAEKRASTTQGASRKKARRVVPKSRR
jgi:hypothetical protein